MRPSNAHCLRLHEEPRFPRFAHQPGQRKLRIHQSSHKLNQFVKDLEIFGHAKLLTNGTLTMHKSSQTWILPKNKNKRTHHRTSQLPSRKLAAHSLHSIVFSALYDKLDARSGYPKSQRRNQFWSPPCSLRSLATASWRFALAILSAVAPLFAAAFTSGTVL